MSRASAGSFADFFPNAPSVLQQKRKDVGKERSQTELHGVGHPAGASLLRDIPASSPALAEHLGNGTPTGKDSDSNLTPQHDDDLHTINSGDVLNGVGSASSLSSTVSSVFSNNNSLAMPFYPGATLSSLTPLTNTDLSPPGKTPSRNTSKPPHVSMLTGIASPYGAPADPSHNESETITPVHTPPEPNLQARPGPGERKGYKTIYDPELDPKLASKDKKKQKPRVKYFGEEEVRLQPES